MTLSSFSSKLPLVAALALVSTFASCNKESRVDRATADKILLFGNGTEPASLDPSIVSGDPEHKVINAIFEGLIGEHPTSDYEPEPGVAESWEMENGARIWTFKLRENARWSNGDPVTAKDFLYAHKRILQAKLAGDFATMLYIISGAEDYHKGKTSDFETVGVKATDDHTLRYELRGPTPYFLSMLKHYAFFPIHQATIEKFGNIDTRISQWTRPGNLVGNGPFILDEWKFKSVVKTRKNPYYWDADKVQLNGIHFFPTENVTTEERMFRDRQLHVTKECPLDKIPWYRKHRPELIELDPYLCVYYYLINTTKPQFQDPRVRQALSLCVDRKAIAESITRAGERPAYGMVPPAPGGEGYDPPHLLKFDPEEGRRLLAEAGYPGGKDFPRFEIIINTHESHLKIAEAVQQMWKKNLGVDVAITNQSWQVYLDTVENLQYDVARRGWIGDFMDPVTFLEIFTKGNLNNSTGWSSEAYEKLLHEAGQTESLEEHFRILHEAETLLLNDAPLIPFYWYTSKHLLHPAVKGWEPKLLDTQAYKYLDLVPDADFPPIDIAN